jgi:hypothetical protein
MCVVQTFEVAHIREQGENVILIVVSPSFGSRSSSAQAATHTALEIAAHRAGLAGGVALVWDNGGRVMTYGPRQWAGYLQGLSWPYIAANVNRTLRCN